MKAKKKIKDIPFGLFNNLKGIYLKKENKVLFIDNDQNEGLTFDFPFILENVNDKFIFIRNKESIKMFSLDYKLVNEFYFKNIGSKQVKFIDNNNIYLREKADDRWGFSKLSIKGNYIWTIDSDQDFLVSSLSDNFLLIKQDKSLKVIDTNNGKTFWQKDFKSLLDGFDIVQYGEILTIKDKIYVYLADDTNSDNSATVCINQNTGDVLDVYYGFAGNLMLHNEELIVASYTTVQTLDLGSNRQTKFDFSEILNALNLQILWNKSVVKSNLLYFVDGHWTATNRCGIVDLKNKKMLWHSNIEINDDINNNIQELKVCCNRLYIHCSDNTLHIFEHEY